MILALVGLFVLFNFAEFCILNTLTFPRLKSRRSGTAGMLWPSVSILIPARNEAGVIGHTVGRLLAQDYPADFEVLVLDDGSDDGTAEIARQEALNGRTAAVLEGQALPPGWAGKPWACAQLARQARGEVLVFVDADVAWTPGALSALIEVMQRYRADCLSVWPTQITHTWSERLVVPLMAFTTLCYLPEIGVRLSRRPAFSATNGQCLAFRREAYERIGGHAAVRSKVLEDVALGRLVKRSGLKLVMAMGGQAVSARMYQNWPQVRDGFAKNILALHHRPAWLVVSMLMHLYLYVYPVVWLAAGFFGRGGAGWPEIPLSMAALGLGIRALSAAASRQRVRDAVFLPLSILLLVIIAARSLWWHYRQGGPEWKGRLIMMRDDV